MRGAVHFATPGLEERNARLTDQELAAERADLLARQACREMVTAPLRAVDREIEARKANSR